MYVTTTHDDKKDYCVRTRVHEGVVCVFCWVDVPVMARVLPRTCMHALEIILKSKDKAKKTIRKAACVRFQDPLS